MRSHKLIFYAILSLFSLSRNNLPPLSNKVNNTSIAYREVGLIDFLRISLPQLRSTAKKSVQSSQSYCHALLCLTCSQRGNDLLQRAVLDLFCEDAPELYFLDVDSSSARAHFVLQCVLVACVYLLNNFTGSENSVFVKKIILSQFNAKILLRAIRKKAPSKVILAGASYDLTNFFLALWLSEEPAITVVYYINRPFLSAHDSMIANQIILSNKWAHKTYTDTGVILQADSVTYRHNIYFKLIPPPSLERALFRKNRVAVYFSGAYARVSKGFHKIEAIKAALAKETAYLDLIARIAKDSADLEFVLFPHPSVETDDSAIAFYSDLLSLPNVSIRPTGSSSMQLYDLFELGISGLSNTGFERIESGHKSLFVFDNDDFPLFQSELRNILFNSGELELPIIRKLLKMSHVEFCELIGLSGLDRTRLL